MALQTDADGTAQSTAPLILLINGSPHTAGANAAALREMANVFAKNGIETKTIDIGMHTIAGCKACGCCAKNGACVVNDIVNETAPVFEQSAGIVVSSPVYYGSANASVIAFLDRLFYSTKFDKTMKAGAAVVTARRGGLSATFDELNKYFTISGMPVVSSQYWNSVHGKNAEEAVLDKEGMQTLRTLAENMSFLVKSIALGKQAFGLPEKEQRITTSFIR
ncbi:MAG: flavodoxin family protein [Bacteroides sp.]|nr:flavodoxin family protein [Prevotella sp.]MCM1408853.1 flavodoxin family protein [Treponema brennaborense]MCM1470787.1 flavodoxin family protein [Bacteroides sp.]